ncbi:MAG: RNA 2',3'-cyclic phosphodiesterase [Pseudomonadota bacterium]
MPRLFTGLEVPPIARQHITLLQTGLKGARWIEPSDLHITLRFIGDVSNADADRIVEALDDRARRKRWAKPRIEPTELSSFGGSKPRSVHVAIRENEGLTALQRSHEVVMQRAGLKAQGRQFVPHITLARFSGEVTPDMVATYLSRVGGARVPAWEPARFVLYSAGDSTGGGPYVPEEVWSLD